MTDPLEHLRQRMAEPPAAPGDAIRQVQKTSYAVPWTGDPRCHEELSWHATADDRVLGVVIRDKIDDDFSWVVLMRNPGDGLFRCIDLKVSLPSESEAERALWAAMREWAPHEAVVADFE
jgi:hypothetical protein